MCVCECEFLCVGVCGGEGWGVRREKREGYNGRVRESRVGREDGGVGEKDRNKEYKPEMVEKYHMTTNVTCHNVDTGKYRNPETLFDLFLARRT